MVVPNQQLKIVLGMDEYLPEEQIKTHLGFATFRKYNQRIIKAADTRYMDWLEQIEKKILTARQLIIFGHSIGITDGDIIKAFVLPENMITTIFYHDEDALSTAVTNLSAILGKNEIIQRTSGQHHTMEFKAQSEMDPNTIYWK